MFRELKQKILGDNEDLPDVTTPYSQILKLEKRRESFLEKISKMKSPSPLLKKSLNNLERKLTIADDSKIHRKYSKNRQSFLVGSKNKENFLKKPLENNLNTSVIELYELNKKHDAESKK